MLQLVPFLVHNQGLHIQDVAARFGITPGELESDLRILICSGLPEGYPDDLLDIHWDEGHVYITQDLDLTRPVRFTVDEACALLTGLETLNGLPELAEGGALESVTLKLMAAAGEEGLRAASLAGPEVGPTDSAVLDIVRRAIRDRSQLRLAYFSAQRDQVTERDVTRSACTRWTTPGTSRLTAIPPRACGTSGWTGSRRFGPTVSQPPHKIRPEEGFPAKLFTPNDDDTTVLVQLTRQGAGLADDYYAERVAPLPDGGLVAEIRFGNTAWLPMFVAQHGGAARILEPSELAAAARSWIEAALARYGS